MERRKFKRLNKRIIIKIDNTPGLLLDISRTGMRVSTTRMPATRRVGIKLQADNQIFDLIGTVHWVNRKYSVQNLKEIGLSIEAFEEGYKQFLDRLFPEFI